MDRFVHDADMSENGPARIVTRAGWSRRRGRKGSVTLGLLLFTLLALPGCAAKSALTPELVEAAVANYVEETIAVRPEVNCGTGDVVLEEEQATTQCVLVTPDGDAHEATIQIIRPNSTGKLFVSVAVSSEVN